ncbi:MAG: sigma-70 family RNA polymerase sigma factor, partial [Hymenobacter sp.]|nr:sigma-70 family RNA polymerase sigma factor [Hymenobacter sp.]
MSTPAASYEEQRYSEDLSLWQAFRAGQQEALGTLFDRYAQQLFAYGHHLAGDDEAVKDAIHTVFVQLWAWRENLAAEVAVKFYLYRSLRRELLKASTVHRLRAEWPPRPAEHEPSIEQQLMATEDEQRRTLKLTASL